MTVPVVKPTVYKQGGSDELPTLDPVKNNVAEPFAAANNETKQAVEYLVPPRNGESGLTAEQFRTQMAADESKFAPTRNMVMWGTNDPAEIAKKKAARDSRRAAVDAANKPKPFTRSDSNTRVQQEAKVKSIGVGQNGDEDDGWTSSIRKYADTADKYGGDKFRSLAGDNPKAVFKSVKDITTTDGEGVNLDFAAIQKRVESAFGAGAAGSSNLISDDMKNQIVLQANAITGSDDVGIIIGDSITLVQSDEIDDVRGVTSLIERITSSGSIGVIGEQLGLEDFAAQAALINGLAVKAIGWGIPEILDGVIDIIRDIRQKNAMYEQLCIRAASMGNLSGTKHYGDKMGQSRRTKIAGVVIRNLISRFVKTRNNNDSDTVWGSRLLGVLGQFDIAWDKDPYDENITSLTYYSIASRDAEAVLRQTDRRIHMAAGRKVRFESPEIVMSRNFPDLII